MKWPEAVVRIVVIVGVCYFINSCYRACNENERIHVEHRMK
jgi:hypothetical protein